MSTINYTYNVIVDRFRQFAAGHFQLRRFTHGEISQADLEKEAEWPWLHVKPRAINYAPGTRTFSFEIFISDLPRDKEDKTGYQAESITDCSLIFQDLINEIYLGNMFGSDVVLTRPVNAEPFVEQYTHTLTGVTGIIELNLDYDWSACSIPASWNYNTPTDSGADGWGALQFIESLDQNGAFVSLLNDVEAPGNSYYYGTNASGVKGWYAIVDNVGLTCETLPDCATIISILDDIAALQTDVALKANTADLGATAFSNDYNDLDNLPTIPAAQVNSDWNATSGVAEILNKPTIPAQYNPTAGTGVSITGTYPNQTITNTAPDQVVALTAGTNIGVTGTYPNFTISNTQSLAGYVPTTRSITINGTTQDLSADRTFSVGTVTSVAALTLGTTGTDLSSTVATGTTTPVITLNVPTASATNRGALSSADWSTFNGKFTLPSLTSGSVLFSNGTTIAQNNANFFWDNTNNRLGIGTASPAFSLDVNGTARMSGSLNVGSGSLSNSSLFISRNITGSTNVSSVLNTSTIQSDVTFAGAGFASQIGTQNTTFTLTLLRHFAALQGTIGAGSIVSNQYGFHASSGLISAQNNFGFRGEIPAGSTNWNLYMGGTANNYLAGNLLINTTTDAGYRLDVNGSVRTTGSISAASALARGTYLNQTLVATANNDVLVGLDINPTFTTGAFTGVSQIGLRVAGTIIPTVNTGFNIGTNSAAYGRVFSARFAGTSISDVTLSATGTTANINFQLNDSSGNIVGRFFNTTGNLTLQNGGTFTDVASSRLTINSTTQGFLPPRMTNAQRLAIASPAVGLIVYCTDAVEGLYVNKSTGWTFVI